MSLRITQIYMYVEHMCPSANEGYSAPFAFVMLAVQGYPRAFTCRLVVARSFSSSTMICRVFCGFGGIVVKEDIHTVCTNKGGSSGQNRVSGHSLGERLNANTVLPS